MDPNKKQALIKWLNALSKHKLQSFHDLRDGSIIVAILKSAGNHLIPVDVGVDSTHKRYTALKAYIEGFYHQSFDCPGLLDFSVLESTHVRTHIYDMEMGKLLLAIIGCVVQDPKCKEMFVRPALAMDEMSQLELKEMIEAVCFNNQMDMGLPADFHEVLKKQTDTSTPLEATHFLQLLADGLASPQQPSERAAPLAHCQSTASGPGTPCFAMYTNSPQAAANTSGINIRDISSPLRVMSLSSPMTPLSALMNSPQLAQKMMQREADNRKEAEAMLRQKAHEYKKLELALHNEQHLCSELSLDLQEKSRELQEKEQRVRDLERQLGEVRKMRDQLDELDVLRMENDKLQKDVSRLTSRLTEYQDLREHAHVLERENKESVQELSKTREEMKLLESLKTSNDELHVKCHKQQLDMSELEASLQHCRQEVDQLHASLEEARNMYNVAQHTCNTLRSEKEELEELVAVRTGSMCAGVEGASFAGETMSIVTEKRMSELQLEYDKIKASWIDPVQHGLVQKQLSLAVEAKQTCEERFVEVKKQLLGAEDEVGKLSNTLHQFETRVTELQASLLCEQGKTHDLELQVTAFREKEECLAHSLADMQTLKGEGEARVHTLEKELSKTQTELELTGKELEAMQEASEGRRLTILQLDKESEEKSLVKSRLSMKLESLKCKVSRQSEELDTWKCKAADAKKKEEEVIKQLHSLQSEQIEKNNLIHSHQDKIHDLEEDVTTLNKKLLDEKECMCSKIEQLEALLKAERLEAGERQQAFKAQVAELEDMKAVAADTEERLSAELSLIAKEKKGVELELYKVKCDFQAKTDTYDSKQQKTEYKYKDIEASLQSQIGKLKELNESSLQVQKGLKEDLTAATATIQKRKTEIEKMNKALEEQKMKNAEIEEVQGGYEKAMIEASIQLKQKQDMLESLQGHLESARGSYTKELTQLQVQLREAELTILEKDNILTDTKSAHITELAEAKSVLEKEISQLKQHHKDVLTGLEKDKADFRAQTEELTASNNEALRLLENKLSEKESCHIELECDVKEKEVRIESLLKQMQYLEDSEKSLNHALVTSKTDYDTMKNLILQKEELAASKDEEIQEKLTQICELEKALETSKIDKEQLQATLTDKESTYKHECSKYDKLLTDLNTDWTNQKQDEMREKEMLQGELLQLHAGIETQTAAAEELRQQCTEISSTRNSTVAELQSELSIIKQQLTDMKHSVDTYTSANTDLKADLHNIKQIKYSISAQFEKYREISDSEKVQLEERIKGLIETQAESGRQLLDVKEKAANVKIELDSQLEALATEKLEMERQIETRLHEKEIETEGYWKFQLEQLQEEYEKEFSESKERIEALECDHKTQLEELGEEKDMFYATQVQAYQERLAGLEKVLREKRDEIMTMHEQVELKQTEIDSNAAEYTSVIEQLNKDLKVAHESIIQKRLEAEGNLEMTIGQYETELDSLRVGLNNEKEDTLRKLMEEHRVFRVKMEGELEEKRMTYQQMMGEMQENLSADAAQLRERLSQMKCQYENMLETEKKDNKERICELDIGLETVKAEKDELLQMLTAEKEQQAQLESEIVRLKAQIEELQESLKISQCELESQTAVLRNTISSLETDVSAARDEIKREKAEREEKEKVLEYSQERSDTLTAELSSQQQQLAAVEEEKRVLEEELGRIRDIERRAVMQVQESADTDRRLLHMEKMEIERQLQANMKCYEAVQKTNVEMERQHERLSEERSNLETRNRELEQRLYNQREREKKIVDTNEYQIQKAAELNESLRRQLEEKCREVQEVNNRFNKEMESAGEQFSQLKHKFEAEVQCLREQKTAFEIEASGLQELRDNLARTEAERAKLQDINEKYNIHYNKKKETIAQLREELKSVNEEVDVLRKVEEKLVKDSAPLHEELNSEQMKTKALGVKVRNLETQLDLADRKIRDYQKNQEKGSTVFLGDSSEFQKMINVRENATNASFMENHPSSIPLDDSIFDYEKEAGRPSTMSVRSLSDDTLTPGTRASRSRRRISKSLSSTTVASSNDYNADTMSIGSTTSLVARLRSRDSAASLNKSILSTETGRSTASSVPRGTGGHFHCEDEPIEFEWGRLGELQRRNTLCPAHLKTSYPVETQTVKPGKFREDALRESTMGNVTLQSIDRHGLGSGQKRKPDKSFDSDTTDSKNKQAKTSGCVYQKPGPPTPANSRRSSKGSKSPGGRRHSGKGSRSPRTPLAGRAKGTPKRGTPKHSKKPTSTLVDRENPGSGKKQTRRESVAFSIDAGPLSLGRSTRLTRQQAFIQKQPPSASQVSSLIGMFENRSKPPADTSVSSFNSSVSPFPRVALSFTSPSLSVSRPRFNISTPTAGSKIMSDVSTIPYSKPGGISVSNVGHPNQATVHLADHTSLEYSTDEHLGTTQLKPVKSNTYLQSERKSIWADNTHLTVPTGLRACKSDTDIENVLSKPPPRPESAKRGRLDSKSTSSSALTEICERKLSETPGLLPVQSEASIPAKVQIRSVQRSLKFFDADTPTASQGDINVMSSTPTCPYPGADFSIVRCPHIYDEPSDIPSSATSRHSSICEEPVYEEIAMMAPAPHLLKPATPDSHLCMSPSILHQKALFSNIQHKGKSPHFVRHLGNSPDLARSFKSLRIKDSPATPLKDKSGRSLISRIRSRKNSSTSRFRGTPIKVRSSLSVCSPPPSARSCSTLGETPANTKFQMEHAIPYKLRHPDDVSSPRFALDDSLKKSMGTFKPIKERAGDGHTPIKFVGNIISKLTPRARLSTRVAPVQALF